MLERQLRILPNKDASEEDVKLTGKHKDGSCPQNQSLLTIRGIDQQKIVN